jgi:hypothetical protein
MEVFEMRYTTPIALIAILTAAPAVAIGQEAELGSLLDKGAVRQSKADLEALVPGATTKFTRWSVGAQGQANVTYSWQNAAGGKIPRAYWRGVMRSGDGTGTWSLSGDGRYCWNVTFEREWKACQIVFKVGDGYYMSPSDDRAAKAIPVKFEK